MAAPDLEFGSQTDVGLVRSRNEDFIGHTPLSRPSCRSGVISPSWPTAWAGTRRQRGQQAGRGSQYADLLPEGQGHDFGHDLVGAIRAANGRIHEEAKANPACITWAQRWWPSWFVMARATWRTWATAACTSFETTASSKLPATIAWLRCRWNWKHHRGGGRAVR